MEVYVIMKKILKFFVYGISIICITAVIYLLGVKSSQDDIVFELSCSDAYSAFAKYYTLKEDNTLIWAYGTGKQGGYPYGMLISTIDEQGFVKVSDEDAKEMKKIVKKTLKYYPPVKSDSSRSVNGEAEVILKYKNKYYNAYYPKEKYENNMDKDFNIYKLHKKMKKYVEKYKEMGAHVYYE